MRYIEREQALSHRSLLLSWIWVLLCVICRFGAAQTLNNADSGPHFTVTLAPGAAAQSHRFAEQAPSEVLDGRVYVIITRKGDVEPRLQGIGMDQDAPPVTFGVADKGPNFCIPLRGHLVRT
jgi:hypothetical protein